MTKKSSGHSPICKKILMESSFVKNVFCNFKYNLNFLRGSRNGRLFLVSSVHFLLWLSSFQKWGTKYLPKNQHTQRKLLNFENWCSGRCQKKPKFDFQSQFSMSKIIWIFLNSFFSLKNINLGAHFLLLTWFDKIIS